MEAAKLNTDSAIEAVKPTAKPDTEIKEKGEQLNPRFEGVYGTFVNVRLSMNLAFLVWRAIEVDHNDAAKLSDADAIFIIVPCIFLLYFVVDIFIRQMSVVESLSIQRPWCILDAFLAVCLLVEIIWGCLTSDGYNVIYSFQVLRICCFFQGSTVPELAILVKGIFVASRSVFFTILLHVSMTFCFALVFTKSSQGYAPLQPFFEDVHESMHTLLVYGVVFNVTELAQALQAQNGWLELLLVLYCFLNFIILVLMAGVIGEVVSVVASSEKDVLVERYLHDYIVNEIKVPTNIVSKAAWESLMQNETFQCILRAVGVDFDCVAEAIKKAFARGGDIPAEELARLILHYRMSEQVRVKDLVYHTQVLQQGTVGQGSLTSAEGIAVPTADATSVQQAMNACLQPLFEKLQSHEKLLSHILEEAHNMPGAVQDREFFQIEAA